MPTKRVKPDSPHAFTPRPSAAANPVDAAPAGSLHRSGAVARMLRMPVATLRVWERRYALTDTAQSPGGQRLYSAQDVRRLALLKQLSDLGHAIGSLAGLDMAQLQRVASTHAHALAALQPGALAGQAPAQRAWRLAVVGRALGARLQRSALLRQLGRPVQLLGPFMDLSQAAVAVAALPAGDAPDAWLLHEPQLHAGWQMASQAVLPSLRQAPLALLYGFAADTVCESLAATGVTLLREPQPDAVLGQWLRHWADASPVQASGPPRPHPPAVPSAPRRWNDDALSDFAALSTTMACECPRHVAELLLQLSRFEDYSAQCEHRSPADADLHGYLRHVAAQARASFEAALEQVALHEGLLLPRSTGEG